MNSALFFTLPQKMWNHRSLQPQNLFCFFIWFFFLNTNAMNGLNLFNKILLKPDAVWKWEMFRFSLLKCAVSYQTLIKIYCILLETLFGEQIKILFEFFIQILLFIFFFFFFFFENQFTFLLSDKSKSYCEKKRKTEI